MLLPDDPKFTIVAVSNAYAAATMTKREEILGHGLFEVFPDNPADPAATGVHNLHASLLRVLRNKAPDTMPVQKYDIRRPVCQGGEFEERYWSPVNSPVIGETGSIEYIIHRVEDVTEFVRLKQAGAEQGRLTDELRIRTTQMEAELFLRGRELADARRLIAERKRAEEALRESEERFRAFLTASSDVIYRMSPDWSEMRYLRGGDFIPDTEDPSLTWLDKYIHPKDQAHVMSVIHSAIQTKSVFELEHEIVRKDGTLGWAFSRAIPLLDANGEIIEWFGAATDVTKRKEAEKALAAQTKELQRANEELRRVNRDLEQFAYSAAHDLKEPLRNVAIYSELIARKSGKLLDPQAQGYLVQLVQNARRMDSLVNDLLAFTQAGSGTETEPEKTNASEALKSVLANLSTAITELGAEITSSLLPSDVRIRRIHLEQLLQNLISNALKYRSGQPPRIHVAAQANGENWLFSVADNGIGIPSEHQERIFGIFKRLHTADQYPGTGIGLAICKRIVERYRGRIWVESGPGEGATFFFTLPI